MTDPRQAEGIDEELLLDHEYDGIREYDNPLPGWWVALFWGTILFCFPYVLYYHGAEGRSIEDEYQEEIAAFAQRLVETFGDLDPDEATIARFSENEVAMAGMRSLFKSKCAQCHRPDGSGNVGPNLTDDYWLHVKKLPDIYQVITNGVPEKGMPSWEGQLTKTQRVLMAAYVASLRRHPVPGKEPQGEEIPPFPTAADFPTEQGP